MTCKSNTRAASGRWIGAFKVLSIRAGAVMEVRQGINAKTSRVNNAKMVRRICRFIENMARRDHQRFISE